MAACGFLGCAVGVWGGGGALFPVESITAILRENISSALMMMSPSVSQSDPERRDSLSNMTSQRSTWNVMFRIFCFVRIRGRSAPMVSLAGRRRRGGGGKVTLLASFLASV